MPQTRQSQKSRVFRSLTLFTIIANILFNFFYPYLTNSATVEEVSANYPAYMTPASYTFSIWIFIYIAFFVYGIIQIMPSHRDHTIYDILAAPVIFINIFCSVWVILYTHNRLGISLIILFLALLVAYRAFRRAYLAVHYHDYNLWLQFPFSLISGWLTVTLAHYLMVYLQYQGWHPAIGDGNLTILLLVILTVFSFVVSVRTYSLVYPGAIAWGFIGVGMAHQHENPKISAIALAAAIALITSVFLTGVFRKIKAGKHVEHHLDY